jgi:hypothetical protein
VSHPSNAYLHFSMLGDSRAASRGNVALADIPIA